LAIPSPDRLVSGRKHATLPGHLLKISIALDGRKTKLAVRTELTKSNFRPFFEYKQIRRLFCFKPDKLRSSPDLELGQAI
jgi:hypothetical protein